VRFLADPTVVRLARWLRLLGHDVEMEGDRALLPRRALEEERTLLTRSPKLLEALAAETHGFLVEPDRTAEQLHAVVLRFGFREADLLGRCSRCNRVLEEATAEKLRGRVWPHILREHGALRRCPSCDRVYWRGGHVERMLAFLARAGVKPPVTG